jgi:hypothetical protein
MFRRRTLIVVVLCAAVGAAAGIAGTAASPKHGAQGTTVRTHGFRHFGPGPGHGRFGGPPVHVEAVVLNRAGDKFITLTEDSGKLKSVSGNDLTITEGVGSVTYKDVTVSVPSDAKVFRNFQDAKLSDLKEGDRVHVEQSSDGTNVLAVDPSAMPARPYGIHHAGGVGDRPAAPPPPGPGTAF